MTRYKEIRKLIDKEYEFLPKNLQLISEYVTENFDKIPFLNVKELSEATKLSVASIVRFAQRIGFDGYSSLQKEIAKNLQRHLNTKKEFPLLENGSDNEDVLTIVANQEVTNINRTLQSIEKDAFEKFTNLIMKSDIIYTIGLGISNLLAQILSYQLNQVGLKSFPLLISQSSFMEQILLFNKESLLIAFSFPPYSKDTISAAKFAKRRGHKVISITNKLSAPVSFYSDAVLPVKSENSLYTNSFAAISVIINAIAIKCASLDKARAKKMLEEFKEISDIQKDTIE